jgi:phosphoserine phosphatase RsbU/P
MATALDTNFRQELTERRGRLEEAIEEGQRSAQLQHLLEEVDAALGRLDAGTYGICDVCHESVEVERLLGDPLLRTCLDHLTTVERRELEQDLDLASRVQSSLLPKQDLAAGGFLAAYHYEPASMVSGDYCDLVPPQDGKDGLYFLLGDVSGKGVAASMLMASLRATVRSLIDTELPVRGLIERVNRLFCESVAASHFATLVCGRASKGGRIEICNAGHCPPLIVRGGGVEPLAATGLPVGLFSASEYTVSEARLAPGDHILLYTDGLTEARDGAGTEYGVDRLSRVVRDRHTLPPRDLIQSCLGDLASFRGRSPKSDDLTLLAIRRVS